MELLVTFLEGVITFISPCMLPMLPLYVAFFAGDAASAGSSRTRRTLVNALAFVAGFALVFTAMGAFASTVGAFFTANRRVLEVVCGLVVVVLGLNYLGVLRIPALQRTFKPAAGIVPRNVGTSFAFGIVFAIGWTPCVGAFLGSALSLAASTAQLGTGVALLLAYSAGLGVPFIVSAVLIDQLEGAFTWVKAHYATIDAVCGALLAVVGVLMATGTLGMLLHVLQ